VDRFHDFSPEQFSFNASTICWKVVQFFEAVKALPLRRVLIALTATRIWAASVTAVVINCICGVIVGSNPTFFGSPS
jgi:hypothetical protein